MKKLLYAILLVSLITQCTRKEEKPSKDDNINKPSPDSVISSLFNLDDYDDIASYIAMNKYRNLRKKKIYIDRVRIAGFTDAEKLELRAWEVHDKHEFRRDSTNFSKEFIVTGELINSSSFRIPISQIYLNMQVSLDIKTPFEHDENGNDIENFVRVYPALSTANGQNVLYLILLGEEARPDENYHWINNCINTSYYAIKNGKLIAITTAGEKRIAKADVINFQNFWKDKFNTYDTSYSFPIDHYYRMLGKKHLDIYTHIQNRIDEYGIILYPCLSGNKLFFVAKGYRELPQARGTSIFEDKNFYDNMDVCPKVCPETGIQ